MKIDKIKSGHGASRCKCRLTGMLLSGLLLGAGVCANAQAAPPGYTDDQSGKPTSNGCKTDYQDGIYLPMSQVKHNYVLLLIFDSPVDGIKAGQDLFRADAPTSANGTPVPESLSCMPDPDAIEALNRSKPGAQTANASQAKVMPKWGMVILGGCPSDCTGPGLYSTIATKEFKKGGGNVTVDRKISKDPDPLMDMNPGTHWGLMFAADDDWQAPGVMVWQIRAKDALHAGRIMKYLCETKALTDKKGYIGHLMIGYKPASET
jgi:hypothetical protein